MTFAKTAFPRLPFKTAGDALEDGVLTGREIQGDITVRGDLTCGTVSASGNVRITEDGVWTGPTAGAKGDVGESAEDARSTFGNFKAYANEALAVATAFPRKGLIVYLEDVRRVAVYDGSRFV